MKQGEIIKTFKSKKGNDVIFRYPKQEDLGDMLSYANTLIKEDTVILLSGKPLTREEEKKYLSETLEKMERSDRIPLVVLVNRTYSGSGEVRRLPYRKRHVGELSVSLAKSYRDEGIGTELFKTLIDQARKMGLRLLILHCFETNSRGMHVYEKLGFIRSGIVPGAYVYKGEYIGQVTMYLPLA